MFPGTSRSCSTSSFSSLICSIFRRIVNCGSIDSKFLCGLRNTVTEREKSLYGAPSTGCRIGLLIFKSNSLFIPNNSFTTHRTINPDFTWKAWFEYAREDYVFNYSGLCGQTISWIQERDWSSLAPFQTPSLFFPLLLFQVFIYTPGFTILSLNLDTLFQLIRQNCFTGYKQAQVKDSVGWGFSSAWVRN